MSVCLNSIDDYVRSLKNIFSSSSVDVSYFIDPQAYSDGSSHIYYYATFTISNIWKFKLILYCAGYDYSWYQGILDSNLYDKYNFFDIYYSYDDGLYDLLENVVLPFVNDLCCFEYC